MVHKILVARHSDAGLIFTLLKIYPRHENAGPPDFPAESEMRGFLDVGAEVEYNYRGRGE